MLSILIPIYNFDVRPFVRDLSDLCSKMSERCEIICLDDASDQAVHILNKEVSMLPHVQYERSDTNLGRSAVRNALVEKAEFENLLILDCDGKVLSDDYLQRYSRAMDDYDVIYGGREYQADSPPDRELMFHWFCGKVREAVMVERRAQDPYKSFMTNNFLIRKEVYDAVKMDESVVGYGHEDTLFAIELKKAGFKVKHIDNPLEHIGLETFDEFLRKSENGIRNLALLIQSKKVDSSITLVRYYQRLESFGLISLVNTLVAKYEHRIFKNLRSTAPYLTWFDLWKLSKLDFYMKSTS